MKRNYIFMIIFLFAAFLLVSCAQTQIMNDNNNLIRNAEMIKNGNNGNVMEIQTSEVNYGPAKGYLAQPKDLGNYLGIVMIHEWIGLNDYVKEMARQLAAEGYVVIAVDLFEGKVAKNTTEARELSTKVRNNMPSAVANMKSAVEYLKSQNNVDDSKIASMGWCFGGGMSMQLALNEKLAATVIYYGSLETNSTKLSFIDWPVLGIFGEKDTSIPVESARKFDAALDELGIENEIYIYPNVGHAFANPSGMNYAAEETKDAWKKTIEFLDRNLKSSLDKDTEITEDYCETDSDCVPNACCHPSRLVNKKFAPDCGNGAICTAVCSGALDCRRWKPVCSNNICKVIFE